MASLNYGPNTCQSCGVRPSFFDVATGKLYPFCGKTCANASITATSSAGNTCDHCHVRTKFWDGNRIHPFCSKSCAQAAMQAGGSTTKTAGMCGTPGCMVSVYKDGAGKTSKYCSKTHMEEARTCCLGCHKTQNKHAPPLCSSCRSKFQTQSPMLLEVPEEHSIYRNVASQFQKSWRKNSPCPSVKAIYKVIASKQSLDKYEAYRSSVEARGQFIRANRSAGNENRRWHGTTRKCTLGDKGCTNFCSLQDCALCNIIRTSFNMSLAGSKHGARFGAGIYTSSASSKSDDYSRNAVQSPWKALLLNKVVVGAGYKVPSTSLAGKAPPAGYDSILAEPGLLAEADELIVFCNDAARPSYLVMYDGK